MLGTNLGRKSVWLAFMLMALLIVACTPDNGGADGVIVDRPGSITDEITLYVDADLYPCPDNAEQSCLRVREQDGDWQTVDFEIEGYDHQEGIESLLRVNRIQAVNQPADVQPLRYELIEIVSQTETQTAVMENLDYLLSTNWDLVTMNGEAPVDGATPTISFEETAINGTTGCNSYFGDYTLDGTNLSVGMIGQTEMYCDGRMEQEQAYLQMLMAAVSLTLEDETLTIHTGQGDLVYIPATNVSLEGTAWTLGGIVRNEAMVNTWVDERITAEFVDGQMSGSAGCNDYNAPYEVSEHMFSIGPAAATRMACEDNEINRREIEFLAALENVASYEIVRDNLTLFDAEGNVVMSFTAS